MQTDTIPTEPETVQSPTARPTGLPASAGWAVVSADNLPPLNAMVWLFDGQRAWIGARVDDTEGWLWANSYGHIWHDGDKWNGDMETDEDYRPTHWMHLPSLPPKCPRCDGRGFVMWRSTGADSNYAESKCPECTMEGKPLFECMMNARIESGYEPAGQGAVYVAQPNGKLTHGGPPQ